MKEIDEICDDVYLRITEGIQENLKEAILKAVKDFVGDDLLAFWGEDGRSLDLIFNDPDDDIKIRIDLDVVLTEELDDMRVDLVNTGVDQDYYARLERMQLFFRGWLDELDNLKARYEEGQ